MSFVIVVMDLFCVECFFVPLKMVVRVIQLLMKIIIISLFWPICFGVFTFWNAQCKHNKSKNILGYENMIFQNTKICNNFFRRNISWFRKELFIFEITESQYILLPLILGNVIIIIIIFNRILIFCTNRNISF